MNLYKLCQFVTYVYACGERERELELEEGERDRSKERDINFIIYEIRDVVLCCVL